jgi:mRNA interferase MazF
MTDFSKHDVVVVKFPFASSLKYKARPAVVISSEKYNQNERDTLLIMAITSKMEGRLDIESEISHWKEAGLLKPSLLKSAIATIEKEFVITRLGRLQKGDIEKLDDMIATIC